MHTLNSAGIGLFGGTFDPVHWGHLRPVAAAASKLGLNQVRLMPCQIPPHKNGTHASAEQRLSMLQLACEEWAQDQDQTPGSNKVLFIPEPLELLRSSQRPSYSIDTLTEVRSELDQQQANLPLYFFIGQDSLLNLTSWHRWQELLDYCHLVVCARPGYQTQLPETLHSWVTRHQCQQTTQLSQLAGGKLYFANTPQWAIASSDIRQRLAQQGQNVSDWLPRAVYRYIQQQRLYG